MQPVGFVVTFNDGTKFTERDGTWDDVPNKKVANLSVVNIDSGEVLASAPIGTKYYFSNEAIAYPGQHVLSGKILGSVQSDGVVKEVRYEVWPEKKVVSRDYPVSDCPFPDRVFRQG
jgi:hypothetical protein